MIRVGILGATGYTAEVLIKLLLRHPKTELSALSGRRDDTPTVSDVHPSVEGELDLSIQNLDAAALARDVDCIFSCLPHATSARAVGDIDRSRTAVVDLSADFRLRDADTYKQWYGRHPRPELLGNVPYGLPELFRKQIQGSRFVANPGCYPTSAILALAPFAQHGLIETSDVIIDSKSGVTGAGRTPQQATMFAECNESVSAYMVGEHRHTPEIAQILSDCAGKSVEIIFTPHLVPMDRGILTTGYARLTRQMTDEDVLSVLYESYQSERFVRVMGRQPATKHTLGTNYCDLTARVVGHRLVTVSCIDNLMKGASAAAIQNMNLMFGWEESLGLV